VNDLLFDENSGVMGLI